MPVDDYKPCLSVLISYPEDELVEPALVVKLRKAANLLRMTSDRDLSRIWDAIDLMADVATATHTRVQKSAAGIRNAETAAAGLKRKRRKARYGRKRRG